LHRLRGTAAPCLLHLAPMQGASNHATFRHYQANVAIWPPTVRGGRAACFLILALVASGPTSGSAARHGKLPDLNRVTEFPSGDDSYPQLRLDRLIHEIQRIGGMLPDKRASAVSQNPDADVEEDGLMPSQGQGVASHEFAVTPFGSYVGEDQEPEEGMTRAQEELEARAENNKAKAKSIGKSGAEEQEGRPEMNSINKMRAEMCWLRPNLWDHQECLKFLAVTCALGSTGEGTCGRFAKKLAKECKGQKDPKLRKKFCRMAKALKIVLGEDDEDGDDAGNTDTDGDGTVDSKDKFPDDPEEWADTDGDGIGDNSDEDRDGDGIANADDEFPDDPKRSGAGGKDTDGDGVADSKDAFPKDPKEWSDIDGDGKGDNSDKDRDGDGVPDKLDKYPENPDRDGRQDTDGDGTIDRLDAFPDDPKEWKDTDKDGIGNNADEDIDGDGHPNKKDSHPKDPKRFDEWDKDGDGIPDEEDDFPRDKTEWKDTDGDGVGDNKDAFPKDPKCITDPCLEKGSLTKEIVPMPEQGYNEYSPGKEVTHDDGATLTGDWRSEWPRKQESERDSILRICEENPENVWCKTYRKHGHFRR